MMLGVSVAGIPEVQARKSHMTVKSHTKRVSRGRTVRVRNHIRYVGPRTKVHVPVKLAPKKHIVPVSYIQPKITQKPYVFWRKHNFQKSC